MLQVLTGTNDDDEYTLRVVRRIARRQGREATTSAPGILFLEIDGLALPVLQHAMRTGSAPNMARWLADGDYRLTEWEPDLSSQTGASQAGILLGSNEDIPAFRWVEKESARLISCSVAADCAEIERRHATGAGLLREALMAADQCANLHLDTSSSNGWLKYYPGLTLDAVFRHRLGVSGKQGLDLARHLADFA